MNRQVLAITLGFIGFTLIGYGIGCLKTRADFMEAVAKSMADHYAANPR